MRREDCIGAFAILQPFNDAENRQHELRNQLMHKGYRAKYTFEDVIGGVWGDIEDKGHFKAGWPTRNHRYS